MRRNRFIFAALLFFAANSFAAEKSHHVAFTLKLRSGSEETHYLGGTLSFGLLLRGQENYWEIFINDLASPGTNLLYAVNPPYRFSNHLNIGAGFGQSARESVKDSSRTLNFLFRKQDALFAETEISRVLWPKKDGDAEAVTKEFARLPQGKLKIKLRDAKFSKNEAGAESIDSITVDVTADWKEP